jgi:uncharacterized protein (TIGR02217 family)
MSGFHEVRFPDNIAYGATGGPEFATTVVVTGAGHEQRNVNWTEARGRWDVGPLRLRDDRRDGGLPQPRKAGAGRQQRARP